MVPKLVVAGLQPTTEPIRELVTKFGGQPVWNGPPTWPIHAPSGLPMEFLCQIRLEPDLFGPDEPAMAYVFIGDSAEAFIPFLHNSAVILQPGDLPSAPTAPEEEGPTLVYLLDDEGVPEMVPPEQCEFRMILKPDTDPEIADSDRLREWASDPWLEFKARARGYLGTRRGIKVGGIPFFHRGWPEPFNPEQWRLALQIDGELPFHLNLGTDGIGYVLVSSDLRRGAYFWERPG